PGWPGSAAADPNRGWSPRKRCTNPCAIGDPCGQALNSLSCRKLNITWRQPPRRDGPRSGGLCSRRTAAKMSGSSWVKGALFMLKVFRDNLKNLAWILWVIIALFVLALAADFGASVRGKGTTAAAATVGSDTVSIAEYQRTYQNVVNFYRQIYGDQLTPELEKQMRLPLQALDEAVKEKILLAEARRLGLKVTDAELRDRILEIPGFKDDQDRFIGEEEYVR